jgi:hypothetical protein
MGNLSTCATVRFAKRPTDEAARMPGPVAVLIWLLGLEMAAGTAAILVLAILSGKPVFRAVILMGSGLVLIWNVLGGLVMYRCRDLARDVVISLPGGWGVKFVGLCTVLALAEEAVTTTMTNLAPVFGVPVGKAYITASANYLDVVCFHSVIVFIPWFIGWAWMLSRWDFNPYVVLLLFGLTGTVAETGLAPGKLGEIGMWVFVYGLMIFLPAYSLPPGCDRGARPPRWWHYPLAVFLPFLFMVLLLPYGLVKPYLHPSNVDIHFPPIEPNV